MDDKDYLNLLLSIGLLSRPVLRRLKSLYFTWRDVCENLDLKALKLCRIKDDKAVEILRIKRQLDIINLKELLSEFRVECVTEEDVDYPFLLKNIFDPPLLLYVRGNVKPMDLNLAIVGTRKPTSYGKFVTEDITQNLVGAGIAIISGLAMGIDAIAHKSALINDGYTIAVLGSGLDRITPFINEKLGLDIIDKGGAVISEYPIGRNASNYTFPERNRIIAGMSNGVLVTEAAYDSGSLITAHCALEEGREVFAVPGQIDSVYSQGTNKLIASGARLINTYEDVLEEFGLSKHAKQVLVSNSFLENSLIKDIYELVRIKPIKLGEISKALSIETQKALCLISELEIGGFIKGEADDTYRVVP